MNPPSDSSQRLDGRQLILTVALDLFTQYGYEATSVDDIRKAAGFKSKSSLYAHFTNKEAVVDALSRDIMERMERVVLQAYEQAGTDPLQILLTTLRAFIRWGIEHPKEYAFRFIRNQQEKLLRGQFDYATPPVSDGYRRMLNLLQALRQHYPVRPVADAALISVTAGMISRAVIDRDAFGELPIDVQVEQVVALCLGLLFSEPIAPSSQIF